MATFRHRGWSIDYTPGSDVTAGDVIVVGTRLYVALVDIDANRIGALATQGVFDFAKEAGGGVTFALGDLGYWDATNGVAVKSAGGGANNLIGECVDVAAADADDLVRLYLRP